MNAWADGKKIESLDECIGGYHEVAEPVWDWTDNPKAYRVAPEPWQGEIWVHPDGRVVKVSQRHHRQAWEEAGWRLITAKEVTDEAS